MMEADELRARIAVWEKVVDVQMHFNEIEMKVRNFAILLISAFLGGAGLALKDHIVVTASQIPLAALLCFACAAVALLFLFVDLVWYHPLLKGAVAQGLKIEQALEPDIPYIKLAHEIGDKSKYKFLGAWEFTSTTKIKFFYACLVSLFVLMGLALLFAKPTEASTPSPTGPTPEKATSPAPRTRHPVTSVDVRTSNQGTSASLYLGISTDESGQQPAHHPAQPTRQGAVAVDLGSTPQASRQPSDEKAQQR